MRSPEHNRHEEADRDQPWRDPLGHVVRLGQVDAEPVQWLSPGRLAAGKITVLDGDPGLGKSTLLCEFAARITRGQALPGGEPAAPRDVIILSAEDDLHDTIRPRIDGAAGDPTRIVSLLAVPSGTPFGRPFTIPGHVLLLEALVIRTNAALVVVDPLMAYLQRGHNANSDQDVRRALASLKSLGDRTGAARCGLLLAQDPEHPERRILAATKGNLGRPPASLAFHLEPVPRLGVTRVVWEGETPWTAEALLRATAEGEEKHSALGEARSWLRQVLADGPRPARELVAEARSMGIAVRTYYAARKAEGVIARKEQTLHGGWILTLPESPQLDQ